MESTPDIKYILLSRSGVPLLYRASSWLAADHLLSIESNVFTETYKRFYFRDIQAILVHKTKRFEIWNLVLGIVVLGLVLYTIAIMPKTASDWNDNTTPGVIALAGITALLILALLLNLIGGRTCTTFLRTAVQIERLPSLARVRATRGALAKIHPLIVEAQGGELSAEAVSEQMQEWSEPAPEVASSQITRDDPNAPPRLNS
ncbi:MAG TPA: hypothetical protein VME24_01630 [Alphaproteobacteria bacterium]|nr:hypothetical protein [Alphaproteobacteria bacterium]